MQERPMTFTVGPVIQDYGQFRLRRRFALLNSGSEIALNRCTITLVLASSTELEITTMLDRRVDLETVIRYLRQWIESERRHIIFWSHELDKLERAATVSDINACPDATHMKSKVETAHEENSQIPGVTTETVQREYQQLEERRGRFELVSHALHELEDSHPDIITDPNDNLTSEDPDFSRIVERKIEHMREWWNRPSGGNPQPVASFRREIVAEYGPFHVYRLLPDQTDRPDFTSKSRSMIPASESKLEFALCFEDGSKDDFQIYRWFTILPPRYDRKAILLYVGYWLNAMYESVNFARAALSQTRDAELANRIRIGLNHRQLRLNRVVGALDVLEDSD